MRRVVALALGLVVSTLLLGGGWLASTWRERESLVQQERERLVRAANVVRGAVDESLAELRVREDERSFYLYSHFYSPPDVLAIADPVAVSPLARPPSDPRLVGYFQVDPDGVVRTPYSVEAAEGHPLAGRIADLVAEEAFAPLRALARGEPPPPPQRAPVADDALLGVLYGDAEPTEGSSPEPAGDVFYGNPRNTGTVSTREQNFWGNAQANDIYAAQAGDPAASARVIQRGRQVPIMNRRTVAWEDVAEEQASQASRISRGPRGRRQPDRRRRPGRAEVRRALMDLGDAVHACVPDREVDVRLRLRASDGRPSGLSVGGIESAEARACVTDALRPIALGPMVSSLVVEFRYGVSDPSPVINDASRDNLIQAETEVVYTPMTFRSVGGSWVLHRVVTHEGVSVLQGVLLDRDRLLGEWLPALVERHLPTDVPVLVIAGGAADCSVRQPASETLDGIDLCFAPDALRASTAALDAELRWQIAALAALLVVAFLAAFLIVLAARRAEALSRQKSAFVSAVSHELRTPLTTLRMHAEMLDEGMVSDDRRPKVHRELVRESVRLSRLVDNVLSLSKLEEGRRRLAIEEGDLRGHVRDVLASLRPMVEERGFTLLALTEEAPGAAALEARFDRQAVEQIVTNLVENAVKYGRGDEAIIEVEVSRDAGAPTLIVRDRGPGVPEDERARVFERFHRVDREDTAHTPGTGIGLALVAELAEAHGGDASIHARDGGGCEVRVRFG